MNNFTEGKTMDNQEHTINLKMVELISQENAAKLINRAYELTRAHPQLRVGQNLWNYVHEYFPDVANMFQGTENDFFYQTNSAVAVECFLKHYVEK